MNANTDRRTDQNLIIETPVVQEGDQSEIHPHVTDTPADLRSRIGQLIRATSRNNWSCGRWATIVGVVPSLGRPCWLVEFSDGVPDVWAVSDPGNGYEFKKNTTHQDGQFASITT